MSTNPFSRYVDGVTGRLGRFIAWLTLCMVVIGAYNAVARYLGRFIHASLSSNLYLELQWYLFSLIFLLGAAYALKEDAHVRVDVVYGRLGRRRKAWINVIGSVLMLIPFCVFVLWVSWPSIRNSWIVREGSPDPSGLPRYPIKAVIIVAFVLLVLQGISQLVKDVAVLRGPHEEEDGDGEALGADGKARGL
jgi:TRAP-type mannitol/chloroaromatic compound transport system permease small subunit